MTAEQLNLFEPAPAMISEPALSKAECLAAYRDICKECRKCGLAESRTQVVYGSGNPEALIMLIGEGPGQHEDETGIPFVGRAGKLLDKILESVGFDRDRDLYITNVVMCRPPGNRVPTQEEMDACSGYLQEKIDTIRPRIILLAGATAVKAVLKLRDSMSKLRGKWIEKNNRWYMPIFHPSYLLRNESRDPGSPKWLMWQDIQLIRYKYDELRGTR